MRLTISNDDGDPAEVRHVYAVTSRRARGVSIGVNLNTNNACNWRCVYCQVPNLVRGPAPPVDLERLERELTDFVDRVVNGSYMEQHVPEGLRRLNDLAIAGRGEPTTSKQLEQVIEVISRVFVRFELVGKVKVVLITNGSLVHTAKVQRALVAMSKLDGEVWFKLDSARPEGRALINDATIPTERVLANLELASRLCRTRIQTMAFAMDGSPPSEDEQQAWLELVREALADGAPIAGVFLYGLDRASNQPEAPRLAKLPTEWFDGFARRIEELGLPVEIHA